VVCVLRGRYALESHSSVVGIREYALRAGASASAVVLGAEEPREASDAPRWRLQPRGAEMRRGGGGGGARTTEARDADADTAAAAPRPLSLFALPAECNFSGARLDLRLVEALQQDGGGGGGGGVPHAPWVVLLDAAKAAATHPPDLSRVRPHFVALSFYKIFGHPTGLGALLVRADALPLLAGRPYWGGGAFDAASADADFVARRAGAPGLEDGTAAFTAAAAVPRGACACAVQRCRICIVVACTEREIVSAGFACLERLGGAAAADAHAVCLASHVALSLRALRHACGAPAAVVYGWSAPVASTALAGQGPTVAFNMLCPRGACGIDVGAIVPHAAVEQALALRGVALRGGCFCNPGACASALGLDADDVRAAHASGHACGEASSEGAEDGMGEGEIDAAAPVAGAAVAGVLTPQQGQRRRRPAATGALRASFGYSSSFGDAAALLDALTEFFVAAPSAAGDVDAMTAASSAAASPSSAPCIASLALYPLKSGAAFAPADAWPLGAHGAAAEKLRMRMLCCAQPLLRHVHRRRADV
jgi:molybdenum cofactor sulfurtransferase